jgi:hypothetical protein
MGVSLAVAQGDGATDNIPISNVANSLLPCEPASQGWKLLHTTGSINTFDQNFTQWISGNNSNTTLPTSWVYRSQDSTVYSAGGTPDLRSEWQVDDPGSFDLRMTYRNSGNDAIFYKMLTRGSFAWSVGIEYAIENNVNAGKQSAGSVFDIWAPTPPASQIYNSYASGKWNQARIVAKGDSVEHWLNNRRVGRYKMWDANWNNARANSKWSEDNNMGQNTNGCRCMVPRGFVGFQGDHNGTWHIRDFRILMNAANVKTGPIAPAGTQNPCTTPTSIMERGSAQNGLTYSLERSQGTIRLNLKEIIAKKAEVIGLDGKVAAITSIERGGSSVLIQKWTQSGIFVFRILADGNVTYREKIFLP